MIVYLIKYDEIISLKLPVGINGNYWLKYIDETSDSINLINIEVDGQSYVAKSNIEAKIEYNGDYLEKVNLLPYVFYTVNYKSLKMMLYSMPIKEPTGGKYTINSNVITIGKKIGNTITFNNPLINDTHAIINLENGPEITCYDEKYGIYVNKKRTNVKKIEVGDEIFICGLRIIYMGNFWFINNPNSLVTESEVIKLYESPTNSAITIKSDMYLNQYNESDYFEKSPRFITEFEPQRVVIDPPPEKKEENDMPLILTVGPMMTMSLMSMVTIWQTVDRISQGASFRESLPSIVISIIMIITLIMWPILSTRFQRKRDKRKEEERQEKYQKYLLRKTFEIHTLMNREKQVFTENNASLEECQNIIYNKKRNLWEREIIHQDFLTVRLGIGSKKPNIEIVYPEDHFTMSEDNLKELLNRTVQRQEYIHEIPIKLSLSEKNITAIIGDEYLTEKFFDSLLLQIMTFHSYRDLKIVILKSKSDERMEYLKLSPHIFSDDMQMRFFGDNQDDIEQISNYLSRVFDVRRYDANGILLEQDYKYYGTYYLIIADNVLRIKHINIINKILTSSVNVGFTILFRSHNMTSLPKECKTFITIDGDNGKTSGYFENELVASKQQAFQADLNIQNRANMKKCVEALSKIPLKLKDSSQKMPKILSFLEMYNVGNVNQLNSENRWNTNNPTVSLSVPIGIDVGGELFKLDLHEKRHGPHGLIAGMTGSGKSELIITYILSLAINYHPYEVSFVLIDYKGGGLTGAFENRNTGFVLPHLAGTITNLDDSTMNRALVSIRAELERRQVLFKEARENLGESTIDIYKYQKLYRDGKVEKPVSHLFIISDEFAELKQQKPEFMHELISAARIGRSLGVHLILSTQKPSGIVDDQIWSNSKFKICLKVQDKNDSNDVIGRPDAALLSDAGRFFLQVGYNEYFSLGQSAYTGAPYFPERKRMKKVDTAIDFIDNVGNVIKSADNEVVAIKPEGEEITNTVRYLINIANKNKIHIDKLWLDKLKNIIYLDDLKNKYNYIPEKEMINPIIGEFDDPNRQRQGLLTLPLSKEGNTLIYGMAGSGKEDLLKTMIYSIITIYSLNEVNLYIMDFGSETLKVFNKAPQVGDVVTSIQEDKIENLFKLLVSIIDNRKTILSNANTDFNLYNSKGNEKMSTIIVVINHYEAFQEMYEDYAETLTSLSRECTKYGIILVITATSTSSLRYKFSQNFKQCILLQLADKLDYRTILGKTDVYPSENIGRGIIKLDEVYEFQTALICERENQRELIEKTCENLNKDITDKAVKIPTLPEKITTQILKEYIGKPKEGYYPVGMYKDSLEVATIDFKKSKVTLISSTDSSLFSNFLNPLTKEFQTDNKVIVVDSIECIKTDGTFSYYNTKFDEVINDINDFINNIYNSYVSKGYDLSVLKSTEKIIFVFTGIGSMLSKINNKDKFEEMIKNSIDMKNISFILVDTDVQLRKIEYEDWYKASVDNTQGIWLGNGINDQLAIKIIKYTEEGKNAIPYNFGFIINKGIPKYIKMLEDDENGKQDIS